MYSGTENFYNKHIQLPITMLHFWQWAYSNLLQNIQRGKLAEFIVKTALENNGVQTTGSVESVLSPYDLMGPRIPSTQTYSRIEVKSAAFVQSWDIRHPDHATFRIAPSVAPNKNGDYLEGATRQRNNDIYVFTVYKATSREENILDLSLWDFYVLPTFRIETDPKLRKQKTISLKSVQKLCQPVSFDNICSEIIMACNSIPATCDKYIIFPLKS
jgi:hypothetical protein